MAVYYDKNKKCYYIRVKVGEKLHNCYSKPGTKGKFKKRAEAVEYEPIYMASILGERTVKAVIVNDDYLDGFYRFLRTKLKPSTYYGYVNTFDKYWRKKVMNIDVKNFNNTGLDSLVERVFAGKTNWNGKAASGKWFVKYMKKINPDLDPSLVVPPKVFTPKLHEYHIYSEDQFKQFLSVIDEPKWRFLFLLLFNYGLRISECLGLRWGDFKKDGLHIERCACVKNDSHKVIFTSPKTVNSYRTYPIVEAIKPYIEILRPEDAKPITQVFASEKEGAIVLGQSSVRRACERFAKEAGLAPIRLHEFRHSCVSNLLMHGISPRLVARWVGDTESMVLSTYSHLLPSEKQDMAELMNKIVVDG